MQLLFGKGPLSTLLSRPSERDSRASHTVESLFLTQVLSFLKNTCEKTFQFNENSSSKDRSHLEKSWRVAAGILHQDCALHEQEQKKGVLHYVRTI